MNLEGEIIKMYVEDLLSTRQVAKELGISRNKVSYVLNKRGLMRSKSESIKNYYSYLPQLSVETLKTMYYEELKSTRDIAKEIGRSQSYVRGKMKEFNIESRDSGNAQVLKRGINFNETFFDCWSSEMAYVLGFIYADGSITNNRLTIIVSDKDEQIVVTIAELIDFPIDKLKRGVVKKFNARYVGISVSRKYVADKLKLLGLNPNKSKNMKFPHVPKEYIKDFVRGYFDGDGHVTTNRRSTTVGFTCGSLEFVKALQETIFQETGIRFALVIDKRGSINYNLVKKSTKECLTFYSYLYYKEDIPCLVRKKDKLRKQLCQSYACSDSELRDLS